MPEALSPMKPISYLIGKTKKIVLSYLRRRGFVLLRMMPFKEEDRKQGLDWPFFGFTMIGRTRLDNLEDCIRIIVSDGIAGDLVETGVWRGGAVIFMAAALLKLGDENRLIWCADSFEGLPRPTDEDRGDVFSDFSDRDFLAVSQDEVQKNFEKFGLLGRNVKFLKGWFSDTLPAAPIRNISILRMDGDLYQSTKDALESLYHKISPGGFLIIDDYSSWKGCRTAVEEFRRKNSISDEIVRIDSHAVYWRVNGA